jgi:general secretion pathway protein D
MLLALALGIAPAAASAQSNPITLNVSGATRADVLMLLSAESGRNIVPDSSLPTTPVTLRLTHVSLDDALNTLMAAYHLGKSVQPNGTIIIGTAGTINVSEAGQRVTYPLKYAKADAVANLLHQGLPYGAIIIANAPTNSVIVSGDAGTQSTARSLIASLDQPNTQSESEEFVLQHQDPATALVAVKAAIDPAQYTYTAVANPVNNAVVVTGSATSIEAVRSFLASFDRPGKQVAFKVRVLDLEPSNDNSNIGLTFGSQDSTGKVSQNSAFYDFTRNSLPVNVQLNAMIAHGSAEVLAEPTVKTLNNTDAKIVVGEVYPAVYNTSNGLVSTSTVQNIDIGVVLDLKPTIGNDGSVKVLLHAEVSQLNGFNQNYPIIATRSIDDTLVMNNQQTLVIGGLLQDNASSTIMKVPGLGDIPLIGGLFKNKQTSKTKTELAFFITPTIEDTSATTTPDVTNPAKALNPANK